MHSTSPPTRRAPPRVRWRQCVARRPQVGQSRSFLSAEPLCRATWLVLSLLISYCGSSGLAWCVYPLKSMSAACTLPFVLLFCLFLVFLFLWSLSLFFFLC